MVAHLDISQRHAVALLANRDRRTGIVIACPLRELVAEFKPHCDLTKLFSISTGKKMCQAIELTIVYPAR